jgi:formylglycine-generating enzyme required for sulfatase activity
MPRRLLPCLLALLLAPTARGAEPTLAVDLGDGVRLELILVKKGTFTQGSPKEEPGHGDDEAPHRVTLTHDYYLGKYPVTRGQFARFAKDTGTRTEAESGTSGGFGWDGEKLTQKKEYTWRNPGFEQTDDHPVVIVTWQDARKFCDWLGRKAGRAADLPTEAQWEYACRAGTTTRFYGGDGDKPDEIAWYKANAGAGTRPVGKKAANPWGLHDMAGNVFEWCRDAYGPYPEGAVEDPGEGHDRAAERERLVLRGGSWLREAKFCRSAARYRNDPGARNADNGFRVVLAVEPKAGGKGPEGEPADTGKGPSTSRSRQGPTDLAHVPPPGGAVGWGAWLGPCACVGVLGLVVLGVAVLLLRGLAGPRRFAEDAPPRPGGGVPAAPGGGVSVRPTADGFWLELPGVEVGSEVRYGCVVNGVPRTGTVTYEPGPNGTFVYTGGPPTQVEVIEVVRPGGPRATYPTTRPWPTDPTWPTSGPRLMGGPVHHPPPHPPAPPPSPPRPARDYPPAY